MIRRAALVLAVIATFALVAFSRTAGDNEQSRASTNAPPIIEAQEDPYVAWWKFVNTSPDAVADSRAEEDPYIAWWKFATTSQDVVKPD